MQKPDGLVVLDAGAAARSACSTCRLRDIAGIGAKMERRLARDGINDIRQLCERRPRDAGTAWGGTNGDRLWYLLHGVDLPEKPTQSRIDRPQPCSVARQARGRTGAAHRAPPRAEGGEPAAPQMLSQPAARCSTRGSRTTRSSWRASRKLPATQDSFAVLAALESLFPRLIEAGSARPGDFQIRMVGVTLAEIEPVASRAGFALQPARPRAIRLARETRTLALSRAMDRINERFGRNAVSLGPLLGERIDRVGTKIAFGRIPDLDEFHE